MKRGRGVVTWVHRGGGQRGCWQAPSLLSPFAALLLITFYCSYYNC